MLIQMHYSAIFPKILKFRFYEAYYRHSYVRNRHPDHCNKELSGAWPVATTQRYAELSQEMVNKHIKEWNEKWFPKQNIISQKLDNENIMPDFLN